MSASLGPHKPYYHQYYGCVTTIVLMTNINYLSVTSPNRGTWDLVKPVLEVQPHYLLTV